MSPHRLDPLVRRELEKADDYSLEVGTRHLKVLIHGKLACILPRGRGKEGSPTATKNAIAYIRQARRKV